MSAVASVALADHVRAYLAHWRALGRMYRQQQWLLQTLMRELPALGCDDLNADGITRWFDGRKNRHANTRRKWAQQLRHFCLFRQRSDPGCFVPGPELACRAQPYVTPAIMGAEQIGRMLAIADSLEPSPRSPLRAAAMRMAIVLLYTTGLRLGELQRLSLADVEDDGAVLRIRESKFHKTRVLPLSASAQGELRGYLARRARDGFDPSSSAPLLCTRARTRSRTRAYALGGLQSGLNSIIRKAAVTDAIGRRPRIHDLRHSFAVQALARWYRQGLDVQVQLPKLAMYMGHVSIESTAYYLRWTDEIAALASQRYEQCFGSTIGGRP